MHVAIDPVADPEAAWLDLLPHTAPDELRSVLGEEGAAMLATHSPEPVVSAAWNRHAVREVVAEVLAGLHGPQRHCRTLNPRWVDSSVCSD